MGFDAKVVCVTQEERPLSILLEASPVVLTARPLEVCLRTDNTANGEAKRALLSSPPHHPLHPRRLPRCKKRHLGTKHVSKVETFSVNG